eukprot:SAG31_NODE_39450_length_288_cov_0.793651_1_plen_36_part_10
MTLLRPARAARGARRRVQEGSWMRPFRRRPAAAAAA